MWNFIWKTARTLIIILAALVLISYLIPFNYQLNQISRKDMQSIYGQYFNTDNAQIYYEDAYDKATDNAVIFIHGFGGSTYTWRSAEAALLNAGYRVVALDLPGFGLSTKNSQLDLSQTQQAKIVKELADYLGISQAVVVGHSMGGNIALRLYEQYPGFISKLVLVDAATQDQSQFALSKSLLQLEPVNRLARQFIRLYYNSDRQKEMYLSAFYNKDLPTAEMIQNYQSRNMIGDWDVSLLNLLSTNADNNLVIGNLHIDKPVLIIWGAEDTWVPVAQGQDIAAQIPGSKMIVIQNSGHLPMEEQPVQFNMSLQSFLSQ